MNPSSSISRRPHVLIALALLVVLAGSLGVRLRAQRAPEPAVAPPATLLQPRAAELSELQVPRWATPESKSWPLEFRTDLDLIAPLGTGEGNAATWFKDFAKPDGVRYREARLARVRQVVPWKNERTVLAPDDPVLLEAEPWCDQATMRFSPDYFEYDGFETRIPNLLFTLSLARSWVARGESLEDPAAKMADFRRAVRLGRLLRQENVTIIADLVGLACIRIGTHAIYEHAIATSDLELALTASVVLGEIPPQRLMTSQRVTALDARPYVTSIDPLEVSIPDAVFERYLDAAKNLPDRRFIPEALGALGLASHGGTETQKRAARALLEDLAAGPDEMVAAMARTCLEMPVDPAYLAPLLTR